MIYGAYLYFHLLITVTVAVVLMGLVFWASEQQIILACQGLIRDHPTSQQCARLFNKTKGFLVVLGLVVLLLELCTPQITVSSVHMLIISCSTVGASVVMRYARELRSETQHFMEGELSELEPINGRSSGSVEDPEKDSLLAAGGYYDSDSAPDDDENFRRLRPLYASGESSSRDSIAERGFTLETHANTPIRTSADTAVDDEPIQHGKLSSPLLA